jgi:hypothetical protein
MDSQFYSSLKFIRENPVVDMDLTFSTTTEIAGEVSYLKTNFKLNYFR